MAFRIGRRALTAAAALALMGRSAQAQTGDPVAPVKAIFDAYQRDSIPKPLYTPAVANRLKRQEIEADFILDAQDIDAKNVVITQASRDGEKATIEVKFDSFNRKMNVRFDMRVVDGKWMIANVRRAPAGESGSFDMRGWLKLPPLT